MWSIRKSKRVSDPQPRRAQGRGQTLGTDLVRLLSSSSNTLTPVPPGPSSHTFSLTTITAPGSWYAEVSLTLPDDDDADDFEEAVGKRAAWHRLRKETSSGFERWPRHH